LLIHGFINTRKNWDNSELKKNLLAKGYRVIVPDLRLLHLQQKYQPVTSKEELSAVKKSVLVLAGDVDTSNGDKGELSDALPNGRLQIVKGDHNNTYKSKGFSDAVLVFL